MYHEQDCCEDVRIEDIGGDIKQMEALGYLPLPEPTVKIQVDRTAQIDNLLRALNCCYTNMRAGFSKSQNNI